MERYGEVVGLPVICVDNGKKIGIVSDIVFCPGSREAKALVLERKGCQIRKKAIMFEDILSLGKDAVIVNDCSCAKNLKELEHSGSLKEKGIIKGLRIYSKSGDDVGVVKDILFDYKSGKIEGVEVSDSLIQDIMQGRNILPLYGRVEFSEENILVDKEAVEEMMNTGGGLIKKLIED